MQSGRALRPVGHRLSRWLSAAVIVTLMAGCASSSPSASSSSPGKAVAEWTGVRLPSVAFVVACQLSHEANDDPIVHPGHPGASHRHAFFGARTTGASLDVEALRAGGTSCAEPLDTAAYWTPAPVGSTMRAYYDRGEAAIEDVIPYASGLTGIAGDPSVQSPGVSVAAFRCGVLGDGPDAGTWTASPPATCSVGVPLVRYSFGQCGSDRLVPCTSGEAPRWPRLRLLFEWKGGSGIGPHADFANAWDSERLASLVAVCIRGERTTNLEIKQCNLPGAT
jgi:hypothetical protein